MASTDTLREHIERMKAITAAVTGGRRKSITSDRAMGSPPPPIDTSSAFDAAAPLKAGIYGALVDGSTPLSANFASPKGDLVDLYSMMSPDASPEHDGVTKTVEPEKIQPLGVQDSALRKAKRENAALQFQLNQMSSAMRKLADEKQQIESDALKKSIAADRVSGPLIYQGVKISRMGENSQRHGSFDENDALPSVPDLPPPSPPPGIAKPSSPYKFVRRQGYADRQVLISEARVKYSPVRSSSTSIHAQHMDTTAYSPTQLLALWNGDAVADSVTGDSAKANSASPPPPPPPPESIGSRRQSNGSTDSAFPPPRASSPHSLEDAVVAAANQTVADNTTGSSSRVSGLISFYESQMHALQASVAEQASACKSMDECLVSKQEEITSLRRQIQKLELTLTEKDATVDRLRLECEARVATAQAKGLTDRERLASDVQRKADERLRAIMAENELEKAAAIEATEQSTMSKMHQIYQAALVSAVEKCAESHFRHAWETPIFSSVKAAVCGKATFGAEDAVSFVELLVEKLRLVNDHQREESLSNAKKSYESVLKQYENDVNAWKKKAEIDLEKKIHEVDKEVQDLRAQLAVAQQALASSRPKQAQSSIATQTEISPATAPPVGLQTPDRTERGNPADTISSIWRQVEESMMKHQPAQKASLDSKLDRFTPSPTKVTTTAASPGSQASKSPPFTQSPIAMASSRNLAAAKVFEQASVAPIGEDDFPDLRRDRPHVEAQPVSAPTAAPEAEVEKIFGAQSTVDLAELSLEPRLRSTILSLSIPTLRSMLLKAGIPHEDCLEKAELQQRLISAVVKGKQALQAKQGISGDAVDEPAGTPPISATVPSPQELKNWLPARAPDGATYYYHRVTRAVRWDKPDVDVARKMEARLQEHDEEIRRRQAERLAVLAEEQNKAKQDAAAKAMLSAEVDSKVYSWGRGKSLVQLLCTLTSILSRDIPPSIGQLAATGKFEDVKKAYLKALRIVHPDKVSAASSVKDEIEAQKVFTVLTEAYEKFSTASADPYSNLHARYAPTTSMASAAQRARAAFDAMHAARVATAKPPADVHVEPSKPKSNPYAFAASVKLESRAPMQVQTGYSSSHTASTAAAGSRAPVFVRT